MRTNYIQYSYFNSVKNTLVFVKNASFFRKQIVKNSFTLKLTC